MTGNPDCAHGYRLGQDSCPGCDQVDEKHPADSVNVVPAWSTRSRPMCRLCGRNSAARIHREDTP